MASPSKEENILKLILENSPLKRWHFEEIVREAGVSRLVANKWLRKYVKEGLLKRVKKQGSFPYFIVGRNNTMYYSTKRLYALKKLYNSGLITALMNTPAKTVIIFGSIVKGDWYKDSDIDIFILGEFADFDKKEYEKRLNHKIELHIFEKDIPRELANNIINGHVVKGQVQDVYRRARKNL